MILVPMESVFDFLLVLHCGYGPILQDLFLFLFLQKGRFSRSRSSKVDKFGANRKRICDFLLVLRLPISP